jgi:tetratricopeptide (TPR) repeat protein
LMASAVICGNCGAKIKKGRDKCLRCGEPLVAAPDDSKASEVSEPKPQSGRIFLASAAVSVLALGVIAAYTVKQEARPEAPVAAPIPFPKTTGPAIPTQNPIDPTAERPFLDSGRAGNAAYARGDMQGAAEEYEKALRKHPNDVEALNNLGQVLVRSGRAAEAVEYFDRAIALNASAWAPRFNLARAYAEMKKWPEAISNYKAALAVFPDDYATQFNMAQAYHKSGQEEQAVAAYRRAIELAPSEPTFRLSLGISYELLKKNSEAADAYEQYLQLSPDVPNAEQVKRRIETLRKPA